MKNKDFRGALLILAAVLLGAVSLKGQSYKQLSPEEKKSGDDLLFSVTFDNANSANANFAIGSKQSVNLGNTSLALRGILGFDGGNAFRAIGQETLRFKIKDNARPGEGTLILWVKGDDYDPAEMKKDGKPILPVGLNDFNFADGLGNKCYLALWMDKGELVAHWNSSYPPTEGLTYMNLRVPVPFKKGQWFQVAMTWNVEKIALYLNGEPAGEGALNPLKARQSVNLVPAEDKYFSILEHYNRPRDTATDVDDIQIFSTAFSPLRVKNQFLRLCEGNAAAQIREIQLALSGMSDAQKRDDLMKAELDCLAMSPDKKKALNGASVTYQLSGPENFQKSGGFPLTSAKYEFLLDGIAKPGEYTLRVEIKLTDGRIEKAETKIVRPDLSFLKSTLGQADTVPTPWTPLVYDAKDRTVGVWNRKYFFGAGPFPEKIIAGGRNLLAAPPELLIQTATSGFAPEQIIWTADGAVGHGNKYLELIKGWIAGWFVKRGESYVELTGHGRAKDFTIDYTTRIEFDGLIKVDYVINGQPEIKAMKLAWQVESEFRDYLMVPKLQKNDSGVFEFDYPNFQGDDDQLWLVSEKGGFCWAMANDANWIYGREEKILKADKNTGKCEVNMITRPAKLPAAVPYQALFIATPTRPLATPERLNRFFLKYLNGSPESNNAPRAIHTDSLGIWESPGFESAYNYKPVPGAFEDELDGIPPKSIAPFGLSDQMTTLDPVAMYFREYWDIPGNYLYAFQPILRFGQPRMKSLSVNACAATPMNACRLANLDTALRNPNGDRIGAIYYDICGNSLCANPLHGCGFTDKFGRRIATFGVLNKREIIKHTVRYAHAKGLPVVLHAQRLYSPIMHGLGDYWFPGEQFVALIERNRYGYTDEVDEELYRSEFNRRVLGIDVLFLLQYNISPPAETEAMAAIMTLYDVDWSQAGSANIDMTVRLWEIYGRYNLGDAQAKAHRFFEQTEVKSDNPVVRVTWYEGPSGEKLLAVVNTTKVEKSAVIDLAALKSGNFTAFEEFFRTPVEVQDGKFRITLPSRSLRLVALEPKPYYPRDTHASNIHRCWKTDKAVGIFRLGWTDNQPAVRVDIGPKSPADAIFRFSEGFPAIAGKTYTADVWFKTENVDDGAFIRLAFNAVEADGRALGAPSQIQSPAGLAMKPGWQKETIRWTLPVDWPKAKGIVLAMTAGGTTKGKVWFGKIHINEE